MQVRMVRASFGSKIGLANYSNIEAHVELSADIEEGEDWEAALGELLIKAKNATRDTLKAKGDKAIAAEESKEEESAAGGPY